MSGVRCRDLWRATGPRGRRVRTQAVCALLTGGHRRGKWAVAQVLGDLFGLPISQAAVCDLQVQTAAALESIHAEALAATRTQPANVDETGWTQGRTRAWLWAAVTATVTAFVIRSTRSRAAFHDLAGPNPRSLQPIGTPSTTTYLGTAARCAGRTSGGTSRP